MCSRPTRKRRRRLQSLIDAANRFFGGGPIVLPEGVETIITDPRPRTPMPQYAWLTPTRARPTKPKHPWLLVKPKAAE